MADESKSKEKSFEFPMMPIFGVDLGERLGELSAGQKQTAHEFQKLDARMDRFEARMGRFEARMDRFDAKINAVGGRIDKCLLPISRPDERLSVFTEGRKSDRALMVGLVGGLWVILGAGVIFKFFLK